MSEQVILKRKHRTVDTLYEIYDNKLTAFCGDLLTFNSSDRVQADIYLQVLDSYSFRLCQSLVYQ